MIPPVVEEVSRAGTIPSIWTRVGARLFDELLLAMPRLALTIPFIDIAADGVPTYDLPNWAVALSVIVPLLYDFTFIGVRGATPGKGLFQIGVFNAADAGRVAPYQAGLRALIPSVGGALALAVPSSDLAALLVLATPIVYASVTWDPRRRGLHDKAAGTIVLRTG